MKILFFSDSHGSAKAMGELSLAIHNFQPELIVMLGDALYHGPRNALPGNYDTKKTADILNLYKNKIMAVRGNCDAEVDQMMLQFPIMNDYSTLYAGQTRFFLTHGHIWNKSNPPPIPKGTILAHGHTHIPTLDTTGDIIIFNPGSIAIPKNGNPPTYGTWDNGILAVRNLADGSVYNGLSWSVQ